MHGSEGLQVRELAVQVRGGRLVVQVPTRELTAPSVPVTFEVRAGGRAVDRVTSSFVGPAPGRQE